MKTLCLLLLLAPAAAAAVGGPGADTVHAVIIYSVDRGENDRLPTYFRQLPALYEDYFRRASFGRLVLAIDTVMARDSAHAFTGRISSTGPGAYICSSEFMEDIFRQADQQFDFGRYDHDGDGYVDLVIFWLLSWSSRGICPLQDLTHDFATGDTSGRSGQAPPVRTRISPFRGVELRKDLRDVIVGLPDWLGGALHELGHALARFPDMDHEGYTWYDHYALGSFDVMAGGGAVEFDRAGLPGTFAGFSGWPSPFNPFFRAERHWTTYTDIGHDTTGVELRDFDRTGQVLRFTPRAAGGEATEANHYLITYHRFDPDNPWTRCWPLDHAKGGVLVWQVAKDSVGLDDASLYADKRYLPVALRPASGSFVWNDSVNTGRPDPLSGLDSLLIRKTRRRNNTLPSWWPYYRSRVGTASRATFFTPGSSADLTFYSNPNSNLYAAAPEERHARSVTSGFSMRNLRMLNGRAYADFRVDDYTVTGHAVLCKGVWHIQGSIHVPPGAVLTVAPGAELHFAEETALTVSGKLIARGTPANPITFTGARPGGTWRGVTLAGRGADGSRLEHVRMEQVGGTRPAGLRVTGARGVVVRRCIIPGR